MQEDEPVLQEPWGELNLARAWPGGSLKEVNAVGRGTGSLGGHWAVGQAVRPEDNQ